LAKDKQKKREAAETTSASGKMSRKEFEKELAKLQVELVRLQTWVQAKQARVIVVFEGRDTAGKGGVISRITARTSPRVYRHVALPTPSDREKTQLYIQRYVRHFPAAGEIILFDRSWYNRAGIERVMGFCSDKEYERFLALVKAVGRGEIEDAFHAIESGSALTRGFKHTEPSMERGNRIRPPGILQAKFSSQCYEQIPKLGWQGQQVPRHVEHRHFGRPTLGGVIAAISRSLTASSPVALADQDRALPTCR
jgi:hypothetical protein